MVQSNNNSISISGELQMECIQSIFTQENTIRRFELTISLCTKFSLQSSTDDSFEGGTNVLKPNFIIFLF